MTKRELIDHRCSACGVSLQCPNSACNSTRLNLYGTDSATKKPKYFCRECRGYTINPRCGCQKPVIPPRNLSESGTRCLTCGAGLIYCPYCGEPMLVSRGSTAYVTKNGERHDRKIWRCMSCNRFTTRPTCNCEFPYMTEKAKQVRELRIGGDRCIKGDSSAQSAAETSIMTNAPT